MSRLRVAAFLLSLDGYGAGPGVRGHPAPGNRSSWRSFRTSHSCAYRRENPGSKAAVSIDMALPFRVMSEMTSRTRPVVRLVHL